MPDCVATELKADSSNRCAENHLPAWGDSIVLAIILAAAAAARLIGLRYSPGWYHDETIYIGEAWNLIHGHFVWDTVRHTFLPRLPLFHLLVGPLLFFFGKDILWVRLVAAFSGVAMTGLVWRIGRETHSRTAACAGALFFALSSYCVLMTRWGMTYALDAFLGAANLAALIHYVRQKNNGGLAIAIITAALGMVSDPVMASRYLATIAVVWFASDWRKSFLAGAAMLVPLAGYIAGMLLFNYQIFVEDVGVILGERISSGADWFSMVATLHDLFKEIGGLAFAGLIGILFLTKSKAQRILLLVFILDLLAILKLSISDSTLAYRMGIVLCPAIFVGLGALLAEAWSRLSSLMTSESGELAQALSDGKKAESADRILRVISSFGRWMLVACLIVFLVSQLIRDVSLGFPLMPRHYRQTLILDTERAERAAAWLNERLAADDLVIATHLEWLLDSRVASPMLVNLAEGGEESGIYFGKLRERFVHPTRLADARFLVVHEASPRIASIYKVDSLIRDLQKSWAQVYHDELIRIYENPDHQRLGR